MRAPFLASCPELPLEERLDRAAADDLVYSLALFARRWPMPGEIQNVKWMKQSLALD
jgi:hypothetical protein